MYPPSKFLAISLAALTINTWFPKPALADGAVDALGDVTDERQFLDAFEVYPMRLYGRVLHFRPDPARIIFEPPTSDPRATAVLWKNRKDIEGEALRADFTFSRAGISERPPDGTWGFGILTRVQENGRGVLVNLYLADVNLDGHIDAWRIQMFYDSETEPAVLAGIPFYDSRITPTSPGVFLAGKPIEMEVRQSTAVEPVFELRVYVDGAMAIKSEPATLTGTSDYSKPGRVGLRWREDGSDALSTSTSRFWIGTRKEPGGQ